MNNRDYLPRTGFPVYDLRRRKFGICVSGIHDKGTALAHIEGDTLPVSVAPHMNEYQYPKFYNNDEVKYTIVKDGTSISEEGYYVKHVHYHVPKNIWQYTISKQGIEGFDRIVVEGEDPLEIITPYTSPI